MPEFSDYRKLDVYLSDLLKLSLDKKILFVTGKQSIKNSVIWPYLNSIIEQTNAMIFNDFSSVPQTYDIEKGVTLLQTFAPDAIVAIGGGTAMDIAKSINIVHAQQYSIDSLLSKSQAITKPGLPLIAIPTTAGTGSEVTAFAVVYKGDKKFSLSHPFMKPTHYLLMPELTHTLPKPVTAHTGLDALCQAIESFWAVNATPESQTYSAQAIQLILPNIIPAFKKPTPEVRQAMMLGAYYSGKAINIAKTTAAHALSYPLTKLLNIPHGYAVALTLSEFFIINSNLNSEKLNDLRGKAYQLAIQQKLYTLLNCDNATQAKQTFQNLLKQLELKSSVSEIVSDAEYIKQSLIPLVNLERLANNPVKLTQQHIMQAYCLAKEKNHV